MKPTLAMEGTKDTVFVTAPTETQMKPNNGWNKTKVVKVIAVTGVVVMVVAAAVVLAVYFGMKMTKETYKEAWQTYRMADGRTVEEKINKDETSVEIDVPNQMKQLTDFESELTVRRFKHSKTGKYGPCYAMEKNAMLDPTADQTFENREYNMTTEVDEKETWMFTDEKVPSYRLSQKIKDMCYDTEVYWMKKMDGRTIVKRAECNDRVYYYICYSNLMAPWGTCKVCYYFDICDNGKLKQPVYAYKVKSGYCPSRV